MWIAIASVIAAIIGAVVTGVTASENYSAQQETNETNLKIARETNQSNVEQAELAYQRSLPANQVKSLMDAGMSRAGAFNQLAGGGTYSAPVLQAAHMDAPQKDFSGVAASMERLGTIPTNVEQERLIQEQRNSLATDTQIKLAEEERKRELHQYDLWEKEHGQRAAIMLDEGSSLISQRLLDSGKEFKDYASFEDMLKDLGLKNEPVFRHMPSSARASLEESARAKFDAARQKKEQENRNVAAQDAHDIAELRKQIEQINVKYYNKEKHEQLLNLMRVGEGLIQDNNNKFQDWTAKEQENFVREAGIHDEAQAHALAQYVKRLANEDEIDVQFRRKTANNETFGLWNNGRMLLRDLGEILLHVKL